MKRFLLRVGFWLVRKLKGDVLPLWPDLLEILPVVIELCLAYDRNSDPATSGEWKRMQVYGKLQKLYPKTPKNTLALAIEVAVCSLRG